MLMTVGNKRPIVTDEDERFLNEVRPEFYVCARTGENIVASIHSGSYTSTIMPRTHKQKEQSLFRH